MREKEHDYPLRKKLRSSWYERVESDNNQPDMESIQTWAQTHCEPDYELTSFQFNENTRIAHISFLEKTKRRTIRKYIIRQGTRYPVYGPEKTKTRTIEKTIKLTNEVLESLRDNEDELIVEFCKEIIEHLDNEALVPSWYKKDLLENEKEKEIEVVNAMFECKQVIEQENVKALQSELDSVTKCKAELTNQINMDAQIEEQVANKLNAAMKKSNPIFSIISFGIYPLLHSEKRIAKINDRLGAIKKKRADLEAELSSCDEKSCLITRKIQDSKVRARKLAERRQNNIQSLTLAFEEKLSAIQPLPSTVTSQTGNDFIPLRTLNGMKYEKIVGCYVIRNRENGKCYVGQSKDVIKRICKQHFRGTEVKNSVFAEDYYTSRFENKSDLFEVRIIKLDSKSDLDQVERELIEEYDSFINGYNGTKGNTE